MRSEGKWEKKVHSKFQTNAPQQAYSSNFSLFQQVMFIHMTPATRFFCKGLGSTQWLTSILLIHKVSFTLPLNSYYKMDSPTKNNSTWVRNPMNLPDVALCVTESVTERVVFQGEVSNLHSREFIQGIWASKLWVKT